MHTYYKVGDTRLEVFMWSEFFDNNDIRRFAEVTPIYGNHNGKSCKKKLMKDDGGLYIVWDGQKVYLNEFQYDSAAVMSARIAECVEKNDRWLVSDDEIIATIMKDPNVGFVVDMPVYEMIHSILGLGIIGDAEKSTLCIPTEKVYKKQRWYYKLTVEAYHPEERAFVACQHFYMSDFCQLLKGGPVQMVDIIQHLASQP